MQKDIVPKIDAGILTNTGDDAISKVEASESQFAVEKEVLTEFAATNDAFKRIKNQYIGKDPVDQKEFNVGQTFSWNVARLHDVIDGIDGYTSASIVESAYTGYTVRFNTDRADEFAKAKVCNPDHFALRLYPPGDSIVEMKKGTSGSGQICPSPTTGTADDKGRYFCSTNPISNADVDALLTSGNSCFSANAPETLNFGFKTETR